MISNLKYCTKAISTRIKKLAVIVQTLNTLYAKSGLRAPIELPMRAASEFCIPREVYFMMQIIFNIIVWQSS